MQKLVRVNSILIIVSIIFSCARSSPLVTAKNSPICPDGSFPVATWTGYRLEKSCVVKGGADTEHLPYPKLHTPRAVTKFSDSEVPKTFVGLAISGGGSRAAVFGMAVMRQLDQLGILQHVSAISTTSGGGLAGAYYALKGTSIDWNEAEELMAKDFLGLWAKANFKIKNVGSVLTTDKDRSDLMAEVFDEYLFHKKKYGDLGDFAVGSSPIWLANATEIGVAKRFTFSSESFGNLNSDLSSFPISQAVMASAAFPGVFNSVTLRSYEDAFILDKEMKNEHRIEYRHLIDGGATDNLGVEALLTLGETVAKNDNRKSGLGNCLIILIDAHPTGVPSRYNRKSDLRGTVGRLVDLNFLDAIDALLVSRRADLLSYLGLGDNGAFGRRDTPQFVYFDSLQMSRMPGRSITVEGDRIYPSSSLASDPHALALNTPINPYYFRCAAWHINLSGISTIRYHDQKMDSALESALDEQRALHELLVSQIKTSFRLEGPLSCEQRFLKDAIREAAYSLVREDYRSRKAVCEWFSMQGLAVSENCDEYEDQTVLERFPMSKRIAPLGAEWGSQMDESIRCLADKS